MTARIALAVLLLAAPQDRRPNVIVILVDDLGYGDLSAWGGADLRTPHIDALAASGLRMDRFYANCTVCSPTRAALLTGRYPDLVGVPGVIRTNPAHSWGRLSPQAVLLPSLLKRAGYHSAIVGKWHLGLSSPDTPPERGFDHFHGFLGDMMDDYLTHLRDGRNFMRRGAETIEPSGHATDLFTQWAVEYLRDRRDRPEPFFLYLAYNAPHTPIQPPAEWLRRVRDRAPEMPERRAALAAFIEHLDDGVGRVLKALEENGQRDDTLVVFTSDNGGDLPAGASNGPLRGGKQDMWEGGLRVPTAVAWPGRIAPGGRSGAVALTMDLFPTICEAAGLAAPEGIDGRSLLPHLLGKDAAGAERTLVWMRREGGAKYQGRDYYAARRGPWKLLQNTPFEPYRLVNLDDDPREEKDVSAEHPKIVQDLARVLQSHLQRAGAVPWQR